MSEMAIQVRGLGKSYRLGGRAPYRTLRESLVRVFQPNRKSTKDANTFWALKDVNFEVPHGQVMAIIGRNGAGKSTLLKVLSRITVPTEGEVEILGRVGSLLEVGTGFHHELTGRENIYLNGAILGMARQQVQAKFDEIVAFSEVEKFLDTPVKHYSSGMYMRLAFAVAAHLEPDILVVDEVLAVGDAAFQRKCLGKMKDVAEHGRTVLFVSHNMSAVQALCSRAIVMQDGKVLTDEPVAQAVQTYLKYSTSAGGFTRPMQSNGKPTLTAGNVHVEGTSQATVRIDLEITASDARPISIDVRLLDGAGQVVGFGSIGSLDYGKMIQLKTGINRVSLKLASDRLALGSFLLSFDLTLPNALNYDRLDNALSFDINRPPMGGSDRVLTQQWGYGSYELNLSCEAADVVAASLTS